MKVWTVRIRYLTFLFEFLRQNWTKMVCSLKLLWAFKYCLNERKVAWLKTKCSVLIAYVIFQAVAHLSSSAAKPVEIKVKIHLTQNKNLKNWKNSQKLGEKLEEFNLEQRAPLLGSSARSNYYSSEDETEEFRER